MLALSLTKRRHVDAMHLLRHVAIVLNGRSGGCGQPMDECAAASTYTACRDVTESSARGHRLVNRRILMYSRAVQLARDLVRRMRRLVIVLIALFAINAAVCPALCLASDVVPQNAAPGASHTGCGPSCQSGVRILSASAPGPLLPTTNRGPHPPTVLVALNSAADIDHPPRLR